MTTYTDAEVDAFALAIVNAARDFYGERRAKSITDGEVASAACLRAEVRAALAARDALFEVVDDRYEVHSADGYYEAYSRKDAHEVARSWRERKFTSVRVVHVTTKRRKR